MPTNIDPDAALRRALIGAGLLLALVVSALLVESIRIYIVSVTTPVGLFGALIQCQVSSQPRVQRPL